jgi:aspartyl protease family protein
MTKDGGVYYIPCKVNGVPLNFIFDTGASTVSLSNAEASFMFKNGLLTSQDILGLQLFQDATGRISEGTVVNLDLVEIGNLKLYNVKASIVGNIDAPLLLGQSALSKLGKFEFDYSKDQLAITGTGATRSHYFSSIYFPDDFNKKNKFLHIGIGAGLERMVMNEFARVNFIDGSIITGSDDSALIRINSIGLRGEFSFHPLIKENFSIGFVGSYSIGTRALFRGEKEKGDSGLSPEIKYMYSNYNLGGEIAGGFHGLKLLYKLNWRWQTNDYSKTYSDPSNHSEVYLFDERTGKQYMSFGLRFGQYARAYGGLRGNSVDFMYILTRNISAAYLANEENAAKRLADWNVGFGFMWWNQSTFKFQFEVITSTKHKDLNDISFRNANYQISLIYNHNWFY